MQALWRNQAWLFRWLFSALTEYALAATWMIVTYSVSGVQGWPGALPGAWLPLGVYFAAAAWEAGAPARPEDDDDSLRKRRLPAALAGLAGSYALAYLVLPDALQTGWLGWNLAVAFLPIAGYLWIAGTRNSAEGLLYVRVFPRFVTQCLALGGALVALVVAGVAGDDRIQVMLYWNLILFFVAGLVLVVFTRERSLQQDQAKLGEAGSGSESMSPFLAIVLALLIGLTFAARAVLSVDRLSQIASWLGSVIDFLWQLVWLVGIRIAMIVGSILYLVRFQVRPRKEGDRKPPETEMDGWEDLLTEPVQQLDLAPYVRTALILALVAGVLYVLYRISGGRKNVQTDEEVRVNLGVMDGLKSDLKALLGLLGRKGAGALDALAGEQLDPLDPRMLFRRLQRWGDSIGRPRTESETPSRFGAALALRQPDAREAVGRVTDLYNEARYGAAQPTDEAIRRAAGAVESLERPDGEKERGGR